MRLRSLASVLAVLALVVGALVAAAIVWGHERRLATQEQTANARRGALALEQELGASVRALTAMRGAVTTPDPERRDALIQLAGTQVRRTWLQGTAWSPLVRHRARAAYERRTGVRIRDLTADLSRPPSARRDVYFPIEAGEPRALFAGFVGVDPAAAPEAVEAFRAARDSGRPRLSRSARVDEDDRYLIMALAVYGGAERPDTTGARRARLRGYVWTMISGRLLGEELQRQVPDDATLQVREGDVAVGGAARLPTDGARGEVPIVVAGRRYTVTAAGVPTSSWGAPAAVAGAGALLAAAVGLLLAAAGRREREATRAVERRLVERARAEAALRASETRFRSVVEAASDAIVLADADGRIVGWNSGAVAMFGWRRDEAIGQPLTLVIPERLRAAHREGLARAASSGRMSLLGRALELTGLHRDGREIPVELTLASWTTDEGRFYSGILRDVTERNRAEGEIRRQRDYATGLVASLQDGIVVVDGAGTVLEVNDRLCEMTGFAREDLLGRRPPLPYHPPEERARIVSTFAAERRGDTDLVFMRRDGARFPVIVSSSPLYDETGRRTGSVRVIKDVSERERAAREIEEKERFLEAVLESVSEGIVASDADGSSLLVNRALKETIGLGGDPSAEEVWAVGDRLRDGGGAPLPREGMPLVRALAGERLQGVALDFLQEDGLRHVLASGGPILDHGGERLGAVVSFHDVTDEKRAERELRAARELFERAFTEAPIGIALVSVEEADFGRFVQVNRALCTITGRSPETLCALGFADITHPVDAGESLAAVRRMVRGEIPRYRGETRYLRPGGEEVWVSLDASVVRDDGGRALYGIAQIQDVSERRRAGEALRRERDFSRSLVAALQEGVAVVGADGRILDVNPRLLEITGFRREEVVGTAAPGPYWPADEAPRVAEALVSVRAGVPRDLDATMVRADGERFPALVTAAPLSGPGGGPAECVMTFKDMAERLALERMKSEFVALASHELRTPLTSVLGYLQLVLDGEAGVLSEEQERLLRVVERSAERLERLVGDVLLVAQADAGRLRLQRSPVDLAAVVRQSVEGARPAAEAAGVRLELWQEPVPTVLADRDRLAQVLDNLVSNALKFTPRDGRVSVRCARRGDRLEIEVEDTGMGIPQEEQDQLFERFYRSSVATRQAIPGTGLGLAIVKTIVEAHDGSVQLESSEGRGTTVLVRLPLVPAPAPRELQAAGAGGSEA